MHALAEGAQGASHTAASLSSGRPIPLHHLALSTCADTARTLNVYIIPCTAGVDKPGHNPLLTGPFTVSSTSPVGLHICMCSAPVKTHTRLHTRYPQLISRSLFAGNHLQERNTETLAFSDNFCHWQPPHNF